MSTFLDLPRSTLADVGPSDIAILGAPNATPYEAGKPSHAQDGPAAIRAASTKFANWLDHYDFDTGEILLDQNRKTLRDIGDLDTDPQRPDHNRELICAMIGDVLVRGATPIVLGGDDAVPIPVFQAYAEHGPIWIMQIDAHIDWRQERFGEPLGWSSTMRRAAEMDWVDGIVQVGARGVGSASRGDVEDARAWGAKLVTARQVFADGTAPALESVPAGARVVISLDLDGLDPSIMPGVMAQVPGGLTYWHVVDILQGLSARQTIVGCTVVELAPQRDIANVSALTAARIVCNMVAAI